MARIVLSRLFRPGAPVRIGVPTHERTGRIGEPPALEVAADENGSLIVEGLEHQRRYLVEGLAADGQLVSARPIAYDEHPADVVQERIVGVPVNRAA